MLVLTRKENQCIVVGEDIRITVVGVENGKVRLGIEAPAHVRVDREEVRAAKDAGAGVKPARLTTLVRRRCGD